MSEDSDLYTEDDVELEKKTPQEEAFTKSGANWLGEIKLSEYSPIRIVAAQGMGMRFGFVDEAGMIDYRESGTYPGMLKDVIHHIWLRSVDEDTVERAQRSPKWAARQAEALALKLKIMDMRTEEFGLAADIFYEAMRQIADSRAELKKNQSEQPKATTT